jgi:hypothetical protein
MSKQTTFQRLLGAAGVLALCAAALPAVAQEQTVTRDADSGKLRAATSEELQTLAAKKAKNAMRVAAPTTLSKTHSSGARGARLTDEFLTSSVAVRQADGTVVVQHGTTEADVHATNTPVTE